MKFGLNKKYLILPGLLLMMIFGFPHESFSQCEPDLINCIDIDEPGQMCPSQLPDGIEGEYYDHNITVLTPESGSAVGLNIKIHKIKLESVENLPEGISYESEYNEFLPNEAYCISLKGTPVAAGTYNIKITVSPYILFLGMPLKWGEYVDSTSIVMNIGTPTYVDPLYNQDFSVINAYPNPFQSVTKIGFMDSESDDVELRVFNMLGKQLHYEMKRSLAGENYFEFNGQDLDPGYYIYAIIRKEKVLNGRLIKN